MKGDLDKLKKEYSEIEVPPEINFAIEKGIKKGKKKNRRGKEYLTAALILICFMSLFISMLKESSLTSRVVEKEPEETNLNTLGSSDNLLKLLDDSQAGMRISRGIVEYNAADTKSVKAEFSGTNNQVQGVDEEDLVQTDGEYIYSIDEINKSINIVKAYPTSNMKLVTKISLDKNFMISGIFLYNDCLIAIGNTYPSSNSQVEKSVYDMKFMSGITETVIYNIKDKGNVKKVRTLKIEGAYVTSRITDEKLFIVSNKYLNREIIKNDRKNGEVRAEDSAASSEIINSYDKIKYVKDLSSTNYTNITRVDLKNMKAVSSTDSILGFSGNIYANSENLYLAGYNYKNNKEETLIYKYSLKYNKFIGKGSVTGIVLNQFSMDEKDGYFRIATTTGNNFRTFKNGEFIETHNNLYILDKDLKVTGSLTNLAKDERIYSVRFMGDRAYLVTYKEMDPLFVIDIKNPENPKVLGELKIPGFSNYLHPYDANHLMGLGMDSILVNEGGKKMAKPTGLKISLFDVTDVRNPKEMYKVILGGKGSSSEALYNHKAFMFNKDKSILAIPVDIRNGYADNGKQGAAVFNINLNGIKEKGIISHSEGSSKNGEIYNLNMVRRTLYIQDTLYTMSNGKIIASDMNALNKIKEVKLN